MATGSKMQLRLDIKTLDDMLHRADLLAAALCTKHEVTEHDGQPVPTPTKPYNTLAALRQKLETYDDDQSRIEADRDFPRGGDAVPQA